MQPFVLHNAVDGTGSLSESDEKLFQVAQSLNIDTLPYMGLLEFPRSRITNAIHEATAVPDLWRYVPPEIWRHVSTFLSTSERMVMMSVSTFFAELIQATYGEVHTWPASALWGYGVHYLTDEQVTNVAHRLVTSVVEKDEEYLVMSLIERLCLVPENEATSHFVKTLLKCLPCDDTEVWEVVDAASCALRAGNDTCAWMCLDAVQARDDWPDGREDILDMLKDICTSATAVQSWLEYCKENFLLELEFV